jgi:hypothetical protein
LNNLVSNDNLLRNDFDALQEIDHNSAQRLMKPGYAENYYETGNIKQPHRERKFAETPPSDD